jgi:phosphohistidine phosphatase
MVTSPTTRRLVLLRHAKSAWPDVPDHDRPLAPRGRRDAPGAGRWLRQAGCVPDLVLCSTARRARETWALAEGKLGAEPKTVFEERVYGASSTGLLDLARETSPDVGTLLIVGHEPAMRSLTMELASAQPGKAEAQALGRVRVKYPTASVAVLAFTVGWPELGPGLAQLTDFVVPSEFPAGRDHRT